MIQIDYRNPKAIYEQVRDEFKKLIIRGILEKDEKIPSVRELAMSLSINPNTIQRAYHELESEGFIYSVKGKGNFVSAQKNAENEERKKELLKSFSSCASELLYLGVSKEELIEHIKGGDTQ